MLYFSRELPDGSFEFKPRKSLEFEWKLIIVDEVSMIPEDMWTLLLSHKVHVIALGDPLQLPPVDGISTVLDHPHVFLDEIVRQALDNPIIRLSLAIREGKYLSYGGTKEARIIPNEKVSKALLLGADIVICGTNKTRLALNTHMRELKWEDAYKDSPINGDKVICLKNQWTTVSDTEDSLINGAIGTLDNIRFVDDRKLGTKMIANFESDTNGTFSNLDMDYKLITTGEPAINKTNYMRFTKRERPMEFSYGYAITCHKSQGDQASHVIFGIDFTSYSLLSREMVYTGITRAKKRCDLIAQTGALRMAISREGVSKKQTHLQQCLYDVAHPKLVF